MAILIVGNALSGCHAPGSASSRQRWHVVRTALSLALICASSVETQASGIGLRFFGTADLSVFGAAADSSFDGSVTWYPERECGEGGGGEGDFPLSPLDDNPPCVTATFRIDSSDYNGFHPSLSRLMLFSTGMALQLWYLPPIDLDQGAATDVTLIDLALWAADDPENPVFPDVGELPTDLSFLPLLQDRSLVFMSGGCWGIGVECVHSDADPLNVVPEPSPQTLCLVALSTAGVWMRRRRKPRAAARAPR